ncbi:hypothetical protein RND71_035551 [Anisodus tanguticus]|uniref:Uncharacterized protein n=1 Tax=Anisodus tanguticus TaxID=243964 RepID=A0AAE1R582_9SOLA|nr:hypothetical protein RND71_035551 [Anisodus tanguticus]
MAIEFVAVCVDAVDTVISKDNSSSSSTQSNVLPTPYADVDVAKSMQMKHARLRGPCFNFGEDEIYVKWVKHKLILSPRGQQRALISGPKLRNFPSEVVISGD